MIYVFMLVFLPPANEVWGKVIFLHLFVILFTGGEYLDRYTTTPGPGTPPGTRYTPPQTGSPIGPVTPPRPGTPPLGPGTPPPLDQVHPPSQTRYTPRTREIRATSGRYASYWNAFLHLFTFVILQP